MSVISAPGRRRAKLSPLLESLLRSGVRVYDFGKVPNNDGKVPNDDSKVYYEDRKVCS